MSLAKYVHIDNLLVRLVWYQHTLALCHRQLDMTL